MIWTSYPRYQGHVIRPPSEANSLILQVMYGCSHGECTFCGSYLGKPFRVRPFAEVIEDVQNLPEGFKRNVTRVFLADGDALAIPKRRMLELLELLKAEFPNLERISAYANAHSLLRLPQEDLAEIRQAGLELLYLGLESGDDVTLEGIKKYNRQDVVIWNFFRRLKRLDRFLTERLLGGEYEQRLPSGPSSQWENLVGVGGMGLTPEEEGKIEAD